MPWPVLPQIALPRIVTRAVVPITATPAIAFDAITFASPAAVPPTVAIAAAVPVANQMPCPFGIAEARSALRPITLPRIVTPVAPPNTAMPEAVAAWPPITLPSPAFAPPIVIPVPNTRTPSQ